MESPLFFRLKSPQLFLSLAMITGFVQGLSGSTLIAYPMSNIIGALVYAFIYLLIAYLIIHFLPGDLTFTLLPFMSIVLIISIIFYIIPLMKSIF